MDTVKGHGVNTKKDSARNQYKKPYSPPRLMEYGPVEKLTQSGSGNGQEFETLRRKQ
jgi:hypothetical protein